MNREVRKMMWSFLPGLVLVAVLWLVKAVEWNTQTSFADYGVYPRTVTGLRGIFASPFLHGDLEHLTSNSVPLLVLFAGLVYFYRTLWLRVFLAVYLLGGFWLWLGGRDSYHIGASGIVYGLTAFLFFSGVLRRDIRLMALSMLVVFLYGGMVWGIFPLFHRMSWEAHLFGAVAGVLMAVVYRKEGPQRKKYAWETDQHADDDVPDGPDAYWRVKGSERSEESGDRGQGHVLSVGGDNISDRPGQSMSQKLPDQSNEAEGSESGKHDKPDGASIVDIRYIIVPGPKDGREQEKSG